jgi:ribosome biogenesis GTPase A
VASPFAADRRNWDAGTGRNPIGGRSAAGSRIGSRRLERELEGVRKVRSVQRQGRKRHQWPVAAVVGYTNAGKSTLLNLMTGADVLAVDKLFATLDPTTRSFTLPNKAARSAYRYRGILAQPAAYPD